MGISLCWLIYNLWMTGLLLVIVLAINLGFLIRMFDTNRKEWTRLLTILQGGEFNQNLAQSYSDRPMKGFTEEGNKVIDAFAKLKGKESGEYWLLRHGLQALQAGVIITDGDGRVKWMNPAASQLLDGVPLKDLNAHPVFGEILAGHRSEFEQVMDWERKDWKTKWWVRWEMVRVSGEPLGLLLFQEIEQILETESIENWKKMIRILTHEITNSLQPMLSLSAYLEEWIDQQNLDLKDEDQAKEAIQALGRRGEGLIRFVRSYRDFARFSQPVARNFQVRELFQRLSQLLTPDMEKAGVTFTWEAKPGCRIFGDLEMLEQALINLVKNSKEALLEQPVDLPEVRLSANLEHEKVVISIQDNGHGVRPEIADDLFTPFFTTKKQGTGIGLSIVKQLVNLNGGKVSWIPRSEPGTLFRMEFPMA